MAPTHQPLSPTTACDEPVFEGMDDMTTVIHVRDMKPGDVYVGRAMPRQKLAGSVFGNPFKIGMDPFVAMRIIDALDGEGSYCIRIDGKLDRARAIEFYRVWILSQPDLVRRAKRELKGKRLACWCHPKPCHADLLAEIADE